MGRISLYNEEIRSNDENRVDNSKESASCLSPIASSSSSSTTATTTTTTTLTNNSNSSNPFMVYYNNYMNLKLCIDSSDNGNIARFIRKSCTPNCHLEHFIENGQIHFIVMSTIHIPKGAELTLPYDEIKDLRFVSISLSLSLSCRLLLSLLLFTDTVFVIAIKQTNVN